MAEPTFRQKRLGEALKLLRERAGLSQREAADRIDYNVPKLSRIENGQVPDIHALRAMLDVYGVIGDEETPYVEMWELAKEKGWWKQYRLEDQGYISLEHDASAIREFQSSYLPGMVQSKGYMRAVFAGARTQRSRKWVDSQIAVRVRRQERLTGDNPVRYHAIIAESALRHADRDQLLHIANLSLLPNVTIQVVLDTAGLHDGHNGPFTLLDFPFDGGPRVLYVEHAGGSMHIEDQSRVKATILTFKHLSKLALTPEESAAWIERLAAER
ncbi:MULTISPECIES: helix-turn-helix domain-containing protein [Lentzea]|uniref:Helix-turn-helix domain-containing protein n=1 Tax=Lentzea albida TaxID=65499 RepID=A0A1H9A6C7_9PSEU|nr:MULTISPECIES: helix-turn-helix transcriptional regulator [Lentzea]USX50039.1 helix-turn-helix domain-containing protein [Lentzea sp. HUAS12]SEP71538.1 Helix-turn-helix domain-containing protein [Lentzea albida]